MRHFHCSVILILLQLLLPFVAGNGRARIVGTEPSAHEAYTQMALYMTERYISSRTSTLVIKEHCAHCVGWQRQNFHVHLLEHFLWRFSGKMALQLVFGCADERPWDFNVFIVDSKEAFKELRFDMPKTWHERKFHFFIILTQIWSDKQALLSHLQEIFRICLKLNVYKFVVMVQETDKSFVFYSTDQYGPNHCATAGPVYELNRFQNGQLAHDFLFPPPLRNLHGCVLNVSAHLMPPMLSFDGDPNNPEHLKDSRRLGGIDGGILNMLAHSLNFRVNLSISMNRSVANALHNSTGCFKELAERRANIAIGGFDIVVSEAFSASLSYHESSFVFIVHSGLHFGPMKQLAYAFRSEVWYAIGGVFLLAALGVRCAANYMTTHSEDPLSTAVWYRTATINMLTVLMGNAIKHLPHRNCTRILLMSWMLGTLVLRNAYQGQLFDTLRVSRREPVPNSIAELIEQRYTLLAPGYVHFYPRNMTELQLNLTQRYLMVQEAHNKRLATCSMLDTLGAYNYMNWNTSRLVFVAEPVFLLQLALNYRRHSVLRGIIDHRLKQLITSGIAACITKKHTHTRYEILNVGVQRVPGISNGMLFGLYALYATLSGIAFHLFLWELLSRRWRWVRRVMDWMHYFRE